ncbi:MAG: FAD-binding oxidoreductase [Candidatus Jordarchaeaceae archaeon]
MSQKKLGKSHYSRVRESLEKIVGKNFVSDRLEERYYYSSDPSAEEPCTPDFVVMPGSVEEVQEIVRLANREKIPLTPRVGGMTLSGLSIPYGGGILLDLKRMDRIIEVNEDSMYAVVECGVTTGQLKTYLEENHPHLWFCQPHAPQSVGVISNAIIYGAGQISLGYGVSSDMINGLEVVLPTGEILRTGSCALGKSWLTKYCLPDFTGLFLGWFGATGIITKASVQLWPKPGIRDTMFYKVDTVDDTVDILLRLTKSEVCDDIYINSWTGTSTKRFYMSQKPEGIPEITMDIILSGKNQEQVDLKKRMIGEIMEEAMRKGVKVEEFEPPLMLKIAMLMVPQPLPFMDLMLGGGAEYLGCYIPTEAMGEAYKRGIEIAKKYGFQYLHVVRPFRTGHCTGIMYAFPFDKRKPEVVEKLLKVLVEICDMAINLGGVPWKPSPTVQKIVLKHADPQYVQLMKKIKNMLDPNGIMAPGQWAL